MREEDLALDAALARAFEHEKDAETHARAVAEVAGAGAGGAGSAGRKQAAAAALSKPYRYVENYTLRGPKVWMDVWVVGRVLPVNWEEGDWVGPPVDRQLTNQFRRIDPLTAHAYRTPHLPINRASWRASRCCCRSARAPISRSPGAF